MKYPSVPVIAITILTMLIVGTVLHTPFGWITSIEIQFWDNKEEYAHEADSIYHISNESSVLYMDAGDAPYFFKANSSCRYICPLPVERDDPSWNLETLPSFNETYGCELNYTGKYIVSNDGWMNISYHTELKKKMDTEYKHVWGKGYDIYERKP